PDQLVGRVAHRRKDPDDAVPGLASRREPACDVLDLLRVGDGGAAELHHDEIAAARRGVGGDGGNRFVLRGRHPESVGQAISRRPVSARPRVTSSAYSRSPPTGSPLARRVTRTRPRSRSARYAPVPSPVLFAFVARTTSRTPFRSTRCSSSPLRRISRSPP